MVYCYILSSFYKNFLHFFLNDKHGMVLYMLIKIVLNDLCFVGKFFLDVMLVWDCSLKSLW